MLKRRNFCNKRKLVCSKTHQSLTSKKKNLFQNHARDKLIDFAKIVQLIATIF